MTTTILISSIIITKILAISDLKQTWKNAQTYGLPLITVDVILS